MNGVVGSIGTGAGQDSHPTRDLLLRGETGVLLRSGKKRRITTKEKEKGMRTNTLHINTSEWKNNVHDREWTGTEGQTG